MTRVRKRDRRFTTMDLKSVVLLRVYNIHGGQSPTWDSGQSPSWDRRHGSSNDIFKTSREGWKL